MVAWKTAWKIISGLVQFTTCSIDQMWEVADIYNITIYTAARRRILYNIFHNIFHNIVEIILKRIQNGDGPTITTTKHWLFGGSKPRTGNQLKKTCTKWNKWPFYGNYNICNLCITIFDLSGYVYYYLRITVNLRNKYETQLNHFLLTA